VKLGDPMQSKATMDWLQGQLVAPKQARTCARALILVVSAASPEESPIPSASAMFSAVH
jgi:hypothetical protein